MQRDAWIAVPFHTVTAVIACAPVVARGSSTVTGVRYFSIVAGPQVRSQCHCIQSRAVVVLGEVDGLGLRDQLAPRHLRPSIEHHHRVTAPAPTRPQTRRAANRRRVAAWSILRDSRPTTGQHRQEELRQRHPQVLGAAHVANAQSCGQPQVRRLRTVTGESDEMLRWDVGSVVDDGTDRQLADGPGNRRAVASAGRAIVLREVTDTTGGPGANVPRSRTNRLRDPNGGSALVASRG